MIAGLLGYLMVPRLGWQSMFYLGAVPAMLASVLMRLLPESPRWLASQGRVAEADKIVSQIEQHIEASGKKLPPVPLRRVPDCWFFAAARRATRAAGSRCSMAPIGGGRLGVWAMWFCCFSTIYGLNTWMPTLYRISLQSAAVSSRSVTA